MLNTTTQQETIYCIIIKKAKTMKKHVLIAAALLLSTLGAKAQDTVWGLSMNPDYYQDTNSWEVFDTCYIGAGGSPTYRLLGKFFQTGKDPMTIYGIAAMLAMPEFTPEELAVIADTSLDSAMESVAIYDAGPDSLILLSEQKKIHYRDSVPAYYLGAHLFNATRYQWEDIVYGVHEVFFDTPVKVVDSFYVGMTRDSWYVFDNVEAPYDTNTRYHYSAFPIGTVNYAFRHMDSGMVQTITGDHIQKYSPYSGWRHLYNQGRTFLFPILTPRPTPVDTTQGGDTVGIADLRMANRYTALLPNPATERVQVLSSFGLGRIELYNAAGVRVHEQKATGHSATLDVSALPAGPYLVRIATPAGTVTKKLIVQRR